ncbi:MAG: metallophosphoesterase [Candidatus Sumerlaeota bacterium]|nr:metallophosphoesterase [Candidatus Sumerlaeota bacterium]
MSQEPGPAPPRGKLDFSGIGVGQKFSFAICADPQVAHRDNNDHVPRMAQRTQTQACLEINALNPAPAFAVFLGDLANVFDGPSVTNFKRCISGLRCPAVLVHGNHDTHPPYAKFRQLMREACGFEDVWYSFNAGDWHFIALPCNLDGVAPAEVEAERAMLQWLEGDLEANRRRPTMVFEHLHALPIGLSQLEWYAFPLELRRKLMSLLTRHGNVRYYFNGHVHNGIQASVKTAWEYHGISFITAPTIILPRPFGEEYPAFARGQGEGGYYLAVEVEGLNVQIKGRLVGVKEEFPFPKRFRAFTEEIEPRWFQRVPELPVSAELINGDFREELKGWRQDYRYMADNDPAFLYQISGKAPHPGARSAYIFTQSKFPIHWANDEHSEIYQIVAAPSSGRPFFRVSYYLDQACVNGGGYFRIMAMRGNAYSFLMLFKWGQNEHKADFLPRCIGYEIYGQQQSWTFLSDEGKQKRGLYFDVACEPGKWHELALDIESLYDQAVGTPNAFRRLEISKFYIGAATWVNKELGARSGLYVADFSVKGIAKPADSTVDGALIPIGSEVFETSFGMQVANKKHRAGKR